ncbi:MAG: hypothetical protein WBM02_00920 [bacterium]
MSIIKSISFHTPDGIYRPPKRKKRWWRKSIAILAVIFVSGVGLMVFTHRSQQISNPDITETQQLEPQSVMQGHQLFKDDDLSQSLLKELSDKPTTDTGNIVLQDQHFIQDIYSSKTDNVETDQAPNPIQSLIDEPLPELITSNFIHTQLIGSTDTYEIMLYIPRSQQKLASQTIALSQYSKLDIRIELSETDQKSIGSAQVWIEPGQYENFIAVKLEFLEKLELDTVIALLNACVTPSAKIIILSEGGKKVEYRLNEYFGLLWNTNV